MAELWSELVETARKTISSGYYECTKRVEKEHLSLKEALSHKQPVSIIAEIKFASPSAGLIRNHDDPVDIARAMVKGGAIGLSVLTEPVYFKGSIDSLSSIAEEIRVPILMKDIIVNEKQIDMAVRDGADAVLLIVALFDRGYVDRSLKEMIAYSHSKGLDVLLETHTVQEFREGLETDADVLGINNRDLGTMKVDVGTTIGILSKVGTQGRVVVSESGISSAEDVRRLHKCGVGAFLVGSSIMRSADVEGKVRELATAV